MRIDIEDMHGRLVKDVWRFNVSAGSFQRGVEVELDEYARFTRPTTRHRNWEQHEVFLRHGDRRKRKLLDKAPCVPEHVFEQLQARLQDEIRYNFER